MFDEMINTQLSIYDIEYEKFKINKPIRLIELFSGYGSQALALKYLGVNFEYWKTCEWAVKSIQAYKDIHFTNDNTDYSQEQYSKDLDLLRNALFELGISSNYNEPMTREQISRLNEQQVRTIYNNIVATHNLVNIQQVKGEDLEIKETDKYDYILTYSFPCQDLSLAGKGKGMSDTSTRSGMLWEVERILQECKDLGNLPQVLLMENVPQVHSQDNLKDFNKWKDRLEELGYKNYFQDLVATDYGIPQTRNRCFMVSLLGDYSYTFPKPTPLKLKLKDMLEDNVDEKYYLSDKQIQDIQSWNAYEKPLENMEKTDKTNISPILTTRSGAYAARMILVKNATAKGYLEATEGDGIDISSRMETHRGTVQKGKAQTITTMGGENVGVVVNNKTKVIGNYSPSNHEASRIIDNDYAAPTIKENHGTITATQTSDLRIRKLTPRECFRLMGVKDEDYDNVCKNQSDSSLYHLAGDSIVVSVLMAIFGEML